MVVAMYHDQGHGPIKVLGLESGVNITVGLPVFMAVLALWLFRQQKLDLWKSPSTSQISKPNESERDFRVRPARLRIGAFSTATILTLLVPREGVHPFKQRLHDWYTRLGIRREKRQVSSASTSSRVSIICRRSPRVRSALIATSIPAKVS